MEHTFQISSRQMTYCMPEELDHHAAEELRQKLDELIDSYGIRTLILDFSKTRFMDSSGIGVVIGRSRKLNFLGGVTVAQNLNERIDRLFWTSGLHHLIAEKEEGE
jgi:stage II sporulation protein AA (anti-sigma F factor antagonist)